MNREAAKQRRFWGFWGWDWLEDVKWWLRRWLLRKTATPYECYWRDRALRVEAEMRRLREGDHGGVR